MAIELRDGVTGEMLPVDVLGGAVGVEEVKRQLLELMWEESGRPQVYVCTDEDGPAWVLVAEQPVEDDSRLTGLVTVTHFLRRRLPARGFETYREEFRVTYHLAPSDPADPDRARYLRTTVEMV